MTEYAYCNPDILRWARERIGYSIEEAARKLNIKNPERLARAEANDLKLTVNQLHMASKRYSLPVPYFYFSEIPAIDRKQTQNFRLNAGADSAYTPEINKALLWAQDLREDALMLSDEGHLHLPKFPWKLSVDADINEAARNTRSYLDASNTEYGNPDEAFKWWKSAIESVGVLVLETEHHQNFSLSGAAVYFEKAPLIILNGTEAYKRKKLFTLLHEFSHLFFEDSSLDEFQTKINQNDDLEKACNNFARKLLLPDNLLAEAFEQTTGSSSAIVQAIAKTFSVSRFVVVLALRDINKISRHETDELYNIFEQEFNHYRAELLARRAQRGSSGGPPPPIKKSNKLGNQYSRAVLSALWSGDVKQNEAVRMLDNLNISHFDNFAERVFGN